jgi:ATP/maltotriose-dependent transcriptional regulator MalT
MRTHETVGWLALPVKHSSSTKLLPPQCAPGLVTQPRLLDLIEKVQAKAEFGKTSVAVAWGRLQKYGKSIAWLSLDADDD